jgi:hypothetical protein
MPGLRDGTRRVVKDRSQWGDEVYFVQSFHAREGVWKDYLGPFLSEESANEAAACAAAHWTPPKRKEPLPEPKNRFNHDEVI